MSEIMRPIPLSELVNWVRGEYKNHGSVFGIRKEKFYRPAAGQVSAGSVEIFGTKISSPIGPAAGPNSQLAQNILAAYLAGARFMELKTVQTVDGEELRKAVARPCINAMDEGYNVEWSTELTVAEAQEEYVKAWFLCHIFAKEFDIADKGDVVFNMSVGYSFEGIQSTKIDSFIEGMKNAAHTEIWKRCYSYIAANIDSFERFTLQDLTAISPVVSGGITLSTLHGCPREEIEKIAAYLIGEKGLHTYIKCNPTLLGYETARKLLDEMGYGYVSFDDHHFKNDLQLNDAVEMIRRLMALAKGKNISFGVKLTNTFPVEIKRNELPGTEMYMSGRSLFPLSINVAKKLSAAFNGELPISYSGGADYFNLTAILETGIRPVTAATTILKPGGYERLTQLAALAEKVPALGANSIINIKALNTLAEAIPKQERYRKEYRQQGLRKTSSALPLFDCAKAPCMDGGCPIHQRIPDYLAAVAAGNYSEAFKIIAKDNAAPSITGTICDHQCQYKCTRLDYEDPLEIRKAKLIAADMAQEAFTFSLRTPDIKTGKSAAIIGAGPAGIAAAVFLRRNGVPVTVYEKRDRPFGIVQYVIPSFRISDEVIYRDFQMAEKIGVEFKFNSSEQYSITELKNTHEYIVLATGAWKEGAAVVKQGQETIIDALHFLEDSKKSNCGLSLGKSVAVIGGGDVAMDCARAAKRNKGVESVTIVYRRTREFMPSQYEEQELALADGVEFRELLAPEAWAGGVLTCEVMRLGDYDASGRRGIEGTGKKQELNFDTLIGATGARVDTGSFAHNGIALNAKGFPEISANRESSVPGVYIAGDCKAGAATVVKAIADGKAAAADILQKLALEEDFSVEPAGPACAFPDLYLKKGIIAGAKQDNTDGYRCLSCNTLCEICVDVCPNRANVMVELEPVPGNGTITRQIVHIDRMCNECGNCATFCPHAGNPYKDKFTVFSSEEDFADSENAGFLKTGVNTYKIRLEDKSVVNYRKGENAIPNSWIAMIETIEKKYGYLIL
ncbi:putative selenate reductase subunit YgfK [Spirochaetia bacterium]|nr:putative selenate reductase subunit YgfK [Spirochaetia bacterium]